jgi:crotonobetainyl-CoA:carnitine CoA-transferase CaiB-like acyl-CoA transferase
MVTDLSTGLAGAYCTKLFADGGADVIKIEPPGGDPLRRAAESTKAFPDGDGALFKFLSASKQSVVADANDPADLGLVRSLVADADVIVWSAGSPLAELAPFGPVAMHEADRSAVVVVITPFGLDGPWRDRPCTEFTLQALCGGQVQRGTTDRPPLMCGGQPGEWAAGVYAAIGGLASLRRAVTTGVGDLVDVAILDSLLFSQPMFPVTFADIAGRPLRPYRSSNLPGIHPTKDGYVSLQVATGQQWLDFCIMVGREDWLDDERLVRMEYRALHRSSLVAAIDAWTEMHSTAEIVELATLLRIPVAEVGNGENLPQFEHLLEQHFFNMNPAGFVQPAPPYRLGGGAALRPLEEAPTLGQHTERFRRASVRRREVGTVWRSTVSEGTSSGPEESPPLPLAGLRVVDLTLFWAGPVVGHALAVLGAEVIHVESTKRPDSLRTHTVRQLTDPQWWEWSPLFQALNTNKLDFAVELDDPRGRELFLELLGHSDAIIENYSPRVLENWGMGQDVLVELFPRLVVLRAPSYGVSGPWRERLAYAPTMEAQAGLAWMTGFVDLPPESPSGMSDSMAGAHAMVGLLLAFEHQRRTGRGMFIECPMIGASLNVAGQQVVEFSAYGHLMGRKGNRSSSCIPQGVYLTAAADGNLSGDTWVAVSVATDQQWRVLCAIVDAPAWCLVLETLEQRRGAEDRIDDYLKKWCSARRANAVVAALSAAGVPAEVVMAAHDQPTLIQPAWRRLFEELEHPVTGTARFIGEPFRLANGPRVHNRRHAPLLGEHNRDILTRVLGLGHAEVDELERQGVVGSVVAGGTVS